MFLDLETTGLNLTTSRIVQIGIIYNEKTYNILIDPEIPIPADASYVHGVKDEDVKGKMKFRDIAPKLLKMVEEAECLVGYNLRTYDYIILFIEFLRAGIEIPHKQIIDVYEMIKDVEKSKKLKDVYLRMMGFEFNNAHDALSDIKATREVYSHIMENHLKIK